MSIETYLQQKMLGVLTTGQHTVGLFINNGGTEVSGGGYSRRPVTFAVQNLPPLVARNTTSFTFGPATANWGLVTHVGVFDATGTLCFKRKLTTPILMATGVEQLFPVQTLEVGFV